MIGGIIVHDFESRQPKNELHKCSITLVQILIMVSENKINNKLMWSYGKSSHDYIFWSGQLKTNLKQQKAPPSHNNKKILAKLWLKLFSESGWFSVSLIYIFYFYFSQTFSIMPLYQQYVILLYKWLMAS